MVSPSEPRERTSSYQLYSDLTSRSYSDFVSQAKNAGKNVGVMLLFCEGNTNSKFPDILSEVSKQGLNFVSVTDLGGIVGINVRDETSKTPVSTVAENLRSYLSSAYPQIQFNVASKRTTDNKLEDVLRSLSKGI